MRNSKNYWNNKWVKSPITYKGRALRGCAKRISVDVRNFIMTDDILLKEIIEKYGLKKATYNETANACQKFVVDYIKYKDDEIQNSCEDFWQFPFETIASRVGDCEDGAILMASLMINCGIPNWRVKVVGGSVRPQPTAPEGGHAYCIFLADRKEGLGWEVHDWCYYQDSDVPTGQKPLLKNGGHKNTYESIWFTFNDEFAWSDEKTKVKGRISK